MITISLDINNPYLLWERPKQMDHFCQLYIFMGRMNHYLLHGKSAMNRYKVT